MIEKIKRESVSSQVFEQMKENILSGEWKPGDRIPGEQELTVLFGVSRISVRQAIHQLVGMGVLTIRRGEGTFVSTMAASQSFDQLFPMLMVGQFDLRQVLELRLIIEAGSARLAAEKALPGDIAQLRACTEGMVLSRDKLEEFTAYDLRFHTTLALSTHNGLLLKIHSIIHDFLDRSVKESVFSAGYEIGIHGHGEITDAIAQKNPELAEQRMRAHIQTVITALSEKGIL